MKKILLGVLSLILGVSACAQLSPTQGMTNADQINQGVYHQFYPVNANAVPYFDNTSTAQSTQLLSSQALVGNTGATPTPQKVAVEKNVAVACQFNAGSTSGTTDVTAAIVFTKIGDLVTVSIPAFGTNMVSATQLSTADGAAQGQCVPADFLPPTGAAYGFITTNSNSIVPAGSPGTLYVDNEGDMVIYYQNTPSSSYAFPVTSYGGTGTSPSDPATQTITYSTLGKALTVTGSGVGGTVTPPLQEWIPDDTTSLTFSLTPLPGMALGSATDDCGPSGVPLGALSGSNYIIPSVPSQNCTVSAVFGTPATVSTSVGPNGSASPTSINWVIGSTPPTVITYTPNANYYLFSATDDCNGGSPGGTLSGNDYTMTTVTGDCTATSAYNIARPITASSTGNGTITPPTATWLHGNTVTLTFPLVPATGYEVDTVTDDCATGGGSGGSVVGTDYVLASAANTTATCAITANFRLIPVSYTVTGGTTGSVAPGTVTPPSQTYTGTPIAFAIARNTGTQWAGNADDTCNGGSSGGSTTVLAPPTYTVSTVTGNCGMNAYFGYSVNAAYVDYTALGSFATIPTATFGNITFLLLAFPDIAATTVTNPTYLTNIQTVINNAGSTSGGTNIALSIGGALTTHADFAAVGFSTVVSNIVSQINQINATTTNKILWVDLDLEGPDWNPTDIQTLITGFHAAGLFVAIAPQIYYTGSSTVISSNPINLILTAGGGTGNTFGPALAAGTVDALLVQAYNSGGWTIDGFNEGQPQFWAAAATALQNTVRLSCTGISTLCIQSGSGSGGAPVALPILIGEPANGTAGESGLVTIFNPTGASTTPMPTYNQATILSSLASAVTSGMDQNYIIKGVMEWSLNNDYNPTGYNPTDTFAVSGAFYTAMISTPLLKHKGENALQTYMRLHPLKKHGGHKWYWPF